MGRPDLRQPLAALLAATCVIVTSQLTASAADETDPPTPTAEIVVKLAPEHDVSEVTAAFPVEVDRAFLASRGIYLMRATDPKVKADPNKAKELADKVEKSRAVAWAEPNTPIQLADRRFHAWPQGDPTDAGEDPIVWSDQPAAQSLRLTDAHTRADGLGTIVAVMDTGVDSTHPALRDRVVPGWDLVDDDPDSSETVTPTDSDHNGMPNEAYGHGTFVAGIVTLVAPGATVMPYRVLDSDGQGNLFAVAEAIRDAVVRGADVVNLSLGTDTKIQSHLLTDEIHNARHAGVVVVAAAGNDGSDQQKFPAAGADTLSVTALGQNEDTLADFADHGPWVDLAAPGQEIIGPVPGGRYARWAGTSVSTPFVAGQLALLRTTMSNRDPSKLIEAISHSARKLHPKGVEFGAIDVVGSLDYATAHSK